MEVTSTQNANTTQETSKVATKQQSEQTQTTLFKSLQEKETNPKDITYEEYKSLTREEIDKLYPKDTKKEENDIATSLHIKVHMTDDETMNKVLFEKELESLDSIDAEYLKSATNVFNTTFEAWSSFAYSAMSFSTSVTQFHSVAMAQVSGAQSSFHTCSMSMQISIGNIARELTFDRTMVQNAQNGVSSSERFSASQVIDSLEMIGVKYQQIATENQYGQESYFYQGMNSFEIYKNDIKDEYSKRTENNDMILYTHTSISSYSKIAYESYYNSLGAYEEKNYGNDEYQGVKDSLNSIASMIKDGKSFPGDQTLQEALNTLEINSHNKMAREQYKASTTKYYEDKFTDEDFENLLDKLNINDLNEDEKELYKSILKDNWISNEEVESLSFEQMQTLNRFYKEVDSNHSLIQESIILSDYRAQKLLDVAELTMDDAFNEAAYDILKSANSDEEIAVFSSLVMERDKGVGYGSYFRETGIDRLSRPTKDPQEVLENLILQATSGVKSATNDADREFYEGMLNIYSTLSSEYEKNIEEQGSNYKGKKEFNIDISKELIDELSSIADENIYPLYNEFYEYMINDVNRLLEDTKEKEIYEKRIDFILEDIQRGLDGIEEGIPRVDKEENIKKVNRAKEILESFQSTLQSVTNKASE